MTTNVEGRLDEISQRAAIATKGPWSDNGGGWRVFSGTDDPHAFSVICWTGGNMKTRNQANKSNANFIAHSRADIEYLLRLARLAVRARSFILQDHAEWCACDCCDWKRAFNSATSGEGTR
jgi:hypothetical protein